MTSCQYTQRKNQIEERTDEWVTCKETLTLTLGESFKLYLGQTPGQSPVEKTIPLSNGGYKVTGYSLRRC